MPLLWVLSISRLMLFGTFAGFINKKRIAAFCQCECQTAQTVAAFSSTALLNKNVTIAICSVSIEWCVVHKFNSGKISQNERNLFAVKKGYISLFERIICPFSVFQQNKTPCHTTRQTQLFSLVNNKPKKPHFQLFLSA